MPNLFGTKWGTSNLGSPGGVLTWSIVDGGVSTDRFMGDGGVSVDGGSFMSFDFTAAISRAFADWSGGGNIEFMQIEDQGGDAGTGTVADIRIYFSPIPGGTIGLGFFPSNFPSAITGDILIDSLPNYDSNQALFKSVLLHEMGHAMGLSHMSGVRSIMTPSVTKNILQADDIDGIQQIYGVQDNAPTIYDLPDELRDLDILESPFQVTVNGNDLNNTIDGAAAAETIFGGLGDDHLSGRAGDDELSGQGGEDTLYGGKGNDFLRGGKQGDKLNGDGGNDKLFGQAGGDTLNGNDGRDQLNGGGGNDVLDGGNGDDFLKGGSRKDFLDGGNDNDTLFGNSFNDTLNGGAGDDLLKAGGDNDILNGGTGNDKMKGGGGDDTFIFVDGDGNDIIQDFEAANDAEKLDFNGVTVIGNIGDLTGPGGAATQQGADVLIDTGGGNSVLLNNVDIADLDANDFIF